MRSNGWTECGWQRPGRGAVRRRDGRDAGPGLSRRRVVAHEVGPLVTWFLLTEGERRPGLFLGTSSDRIGSPKGTQSYYATATRHIAVLRASPYVTLNYSEWDKGWNVPFGMNVELGRGFSAQPMYDGHRTHLLGTFATERFSTTLIWAWLERVGAAVSFGF